jgi:flagellar basal body-associated protein FliL
MSKRQKGHKASRKKLLVIILALALCAALIVLAVASFVKPPVQKPVTPNQPSDDSNQQQTNDGNTEPDQTDQTNYTDVDFMTPEIRAEEVKVYKETSSSEALETKVRRDFAEHGVEFDVANPYHAAYLNIPEEFAL